MKHIFNFDIKDLPALSSLRKSIKSKVNSIDVFIEENELTIIAIDLFSDTTYILSRDVDIQPVSVIETSHKQIIQSNEINMEWDLGDSGFELEDNGEEPESEVVKEETKKETINFSIATSFLDVLSTFGKCTLTINDNELVINAKEDTVRIVYDIFPTYSKIEDKRFLIQGLEWQIFPISEINSLLRTLDKIEPVKYKQTITLTGSKAYMYCDTLACEAKVHPISGRYVLDSEIIRILKYSTTKNSSVYLSKLSSGQIVINVDGLNVIYSLSTVDTYNLLDEVADIPVIPIFDFNKELIDNLKLLRNLSKDVIDVHLNSGQYGTAIFGPKMSSISDNKPIIFSDIIVNLDTLLNALDIAGENARLSYYNTEKSSNILKLSSNISVVFEASKFKRNYIN